MKYVIEFDLPDNDTVLNNIKTAWVGWNVWGYSGIAHAKPKQPERKVGKWIQFDSDDDKYDVIKCPCCKHVFTVDSYHWTDIGFVKDDFKFCPNCGAKMEEGEERCLS